MFWKKSKKDTDAAEKLSKPREIPASVQKYLIDSKKMEGYLVPLLKSVVSKADKAGTALEIRIFDEADALARKINVTDYNTLDEHPELIIYEGSYDDIANKIDLIEHKKVIYETKLFTEEEIRLKIEAISKPGETVFFYQARGGSHGGPLGMGASVIELNPNYPGKGQKKYNVYSTDVIDMQPVGLGNKVWDSDKPKDIARWVKESLQQRMYSS